MSRHQDPRMFPCQIGRHRPAVSTAASGPERRRATGGLGPGRRCRRRRRRLASAQPHRPPPAPAAAGRSGSRRRRRRALRLGVRGGRLRGGARAEPGAEASALPCSERRRVAEARREQGRAAGGRWAGEGGGLHSDSASSRQRRSEPPSPPRRRPDHAAGRAGWLAEERARPARDSRAGCEVT